MPNLVDCSDAEFESALPGISRIASAAAPQGLNMAPFQKYSASMKKRVKLGIIPGYCSIVLWRSQVLHVDAVGYADLEHGMPMRTDTIMRLYCMGKAIVATGLMVLVEAGRCCLEDPVKDYIPAFADAKIVADPSNAEESPNDVPAEKPLTLRRLLTHCSGLGYAKELNRIPESPAESSYDDLVAGVEDGDIKNIQAFCDKLAAKPLRFQPGQRFEYSQGLDVLGRVIEIVSGKTLDAFLKEAIFDPLGMVDTGFSVEPSKYERLAALYGCQDTAVALGESVPENQQAEPEWALVRLDGQTPAESAWSRPCRSQVLSGGGFVGHNQGGLVSTLNDQARFFLAISRGGALSNGARILQQKTVRDMVDHDWLRLPQCIGHPCVNEQTSGVTAPGEYGWNALSELGVVPPARADCYEVGEFGYAGIAETFWSINPKRELVILWFTQQIDNFSWEHDTENLWLAARKAIAKIPLRTFPVQQPRRRLRHKASDGRAVERD